MKRPALPTLISEIQRNALLKRLEKLIEGVARGKAAWQLWNISPVAAFLNMDTGG